MADEALTLDDLHTYLRLRDYDVPRESQVLQDLLALYNSGQWGEWVQGEFASMWQWNERAKALLAPFALPFPLPLEKKRYPFLEANPPQSWRKDREQTMATEQELIESQDKRIAALKAMLDETRQQLARATVLLQRVRDKEQAKHELQGFTLFRAPNTLLNDIHAFLAEPKEASDGK